MGTADFPALEREGYTGKKLGRFEVMAKLGVGGMSEVFLAWQKAVGGFARPVVLKRISESVKRNEEFLRMFVKEAKITSALNHSGIAHLYELVHEDDELFMVMEFVPGATLVEVARACHQSKEPIPIGFTTSVIRDTALALQYAHTFTDATGKSRPVIHRDVAEKNIMVALDGAVKLLDFGIARQTDTPGLTQAGTVKGTAGYMSPEQVRGEKLDGRTDVFSLGVVLHECLTGQRLFRRNSLSEEVQALLEATIAPPSAKNREIPRSSTR
ncbi:MAG: serine/threonine protein kinase [Archangiaceae bacterium]|nr:serine/threonine protein kinase [Archangiaceae bacterium]